MSMINQAMVFAAGYGKRLKPLTDHTPKPLISIGETTCLDFTLEKLKKAGIGKIVVNTHHLAPQLHEHLKNHPGIIISHEPEILETGGGLAYALPHFNVKDPILIVNGDIWWQDGQTPMLKRIQEAWDPGRMNCLLLLVPKKVSIGYFGKGDYFLKNDQHAEYRGQNESAPYVYPGVCIINPILLQQQHPKVFSLKALFDQAESQKRLYGLIHDSLWGDIGSPQGLEDVRKAVNVGDFNSPSLF